MRFAPEGYPYFLLFGALMLVTYFLGGRWLVLLPAFLLVFMFYFFRDPERNTPEDADIYVSTADGRVLLTKPVIEEEYINREAILVSIFMSPMDVHVNRMPCDAEFKLVKYNKGSFAKAFSEKAFYKNENITMVLEETRPGLPPDSNRVLMMRQVAGTIAQKAVCRMKPGDRLRTGERFGMIKFSSRMDVYLPPDVELAVRPGDRVKAGETVIARRKDM